MQYYEEGMLVRFQILKVNTERGLDLTLAMAMSIENSMGAIQWTRGGPKLVHAKPNNPIVSRGAAFQRDQYQTCPVSQITTVRVTY